MGKIKAVVFDCDGVMFDTAEANRMYYDTVLTQFGKSPLTREQFVKVHMFTVNQALAYLFPEMDSLDEVYRFMKGQGYYRFIRHMKMEPGLKLLLDQLKADGYIRAVATNRTDTMPAVLKEHDLVHGFELVVTAADVKKPKPAPDQLIMIQKKFNLAVDEMIFIGDSEYDQIAARKAGIFFIAFKNKSLDADFYSESMAEIAKILDIKL